jgi:hypothetical protein
MSETRGVMKAGQGGQNAILFETGGLYPKMACVLYGEAASASPKHALVLVGSLAQESARGHSRRFDRAPVTSDLLR